MPRFHVSCIAILAICLAAPVSAEPATDIEIPQGDPDALKRALEKRGWRVEHDSGGDLLVYPAVNHDTPMKAGSEDIAKSVESDRRVDGGNISGLEAMARERGWKVERNADGDLLLYPRTFVTDGPEGTATTVKKSEAAAADADDSVDAGDLDRLEKKFSEKGWQVERSSSGDLLLYPVSTGKQSSATAPVTVRVSRLDDCISAAKESIHPVNISLPLRSDADAKALALAWLTLFGKTDETVGKIRRVNTLYLVSIVSAGQPHRLTTQLVIEQHSGNIVSVP